MNRPKSIPVKPARTMLAAAFCITMLAPTASSAQNRGIRIIKPATSPVHDYGVLIPSVFKVQNGETLEMYVQWTGIPPQQLITQAGIKKPSQFRAGLTLRLKLSQEQWIRVHAGRALRPTGQSGFQPLQGLQPIKPLTRADTPKPPPPAEVQFLVHTVQKGENGTDIARYYGLDLDVLQQANGDTNFRAVAPGDTIYIPNFQGKSVPRQARIMPSKAKSKAKGKARKPIVVPVPKAR